jgi:hypothetical protein
MKCWEPFRRCQALACTLGALAIGVTLVACGGDASNATPTVVASATADRTATPPATTAASATPTVTMAPKTPTGDPAVIAQAVDRFKAFLTTWVRDGPDAIVPMLVPTYTPVPGQHGQTLLGASVVSYHLVRYQSDRLLVLSITMDMHFPGGDGIAWGEGTNTRFVTFEGDPGAWVMHLATSPPVEGEPIQTYQ